MNGGQTIEEKIVDRFGLLINHDGKGQSVEEQLKESLLRFFRWYEVYDFIEIHLSYLEDDERDIRIRQYNELLEQEFSSLYGYTSDEDGIRHGGIDFKNAPAEDAKYMLVSCSAFVNYLIEKYEKVQMDE